jgi:hypothetical protein
MKQARLKEIREKNTVDGVLDEAKFNDELNEEIKAEIGAVANRKVEKLTAKELETLYSELGVSNKEELKSKLEEKAIKENENHIDENKSDDTKKTTPKTITEEQVSELIKKAVEENNKVHEEKTKEQE